jgi:hypothetical protein
MMGEVLRGLLESQREGCGFRALLEHGREEGCLLASVVRS